MKTRSFVTCVLTLTLAAAPFAAPAQADLDCAALANSALAEPAGYAEQCLGAAPRVGTFSNPE